ncbi:hypothetical protein [Succinimonas sp.]|uniref:hypothetical protein n=1 Tax=Succinimonas sp. TaxID=1936151 RepID=UPI0038683CE7
MGLGTGDRIIADLTTSLLTAARITSLSTMNRAITDNGASASGPEPAEARLPLVVRHRKPPPEVSGGLNPEKPFPKLPPAPSPALPTLCRFFASAFSPDVFKAPFSDFPF